MTCGRLILANKYVHALSSWHFLHTRRALVVDYCFETLCLQFFFQSLLLLPRQLLVQPVQVRTWSVRGFLLTCVCWWMHVMIHVLPCTHACIDWDISYFVFRIKLNPIHTQGPSAVPKAVLGLGMLWPHDAIQLGAGNNLEDFLCEKEPWHIFVSR